MTLNFRAECVQRKILDHDGALLDLESPLVAPTLRGHARLSLIHPKSGASLSKTMDSRFGARATM